MQNTRTFPLAVPPETPIKKGVLLSTPLSLTLIPKDIFRVIPTFDGRSAIVERVDRQPDFAESFRLSRVICTIEGKNDGNVALTTLSQLFNTDTTLGVNFPSFTDMQMDANSD